MYISLDNYSINYSIPKSRLAFGKMYEKTGAENVINSELDAKAKEDYSGIVEYCGSNDLVNIELYGDTRYFSKKPYLRAIVKDNHEIVDMQHYDSKKYKQGQFESTIDFIRRVVKKMDERTNMLKEYYGYAYDSENEVWHYKRGKTPSDVREELDD